MGRSQPCMSQFPAVAQYARNFAWCGTSSPLLVEPGHHRYVLLGGIRHTWILAVLADPDEGMERSLLRDLHRDLSEHPASTVRRFFAAQLTTAADHL